MSKIVGFIVKSASTVPCNNIFKAALKHKVFIINKNDKTLC